MIIEQPSAELLWITPNALEVIEAAGRTCYRSESLIHDGSATKFVSKIIKSGHLSVIEHASASFRFICDRGVTHELVRHRLASYSQSSTRYCNFSKSKFSGEIRVIKPPFLNPDKSEAVWSNAITQAETMYLLLLELGEKPEIARSILPNCLKAEIVMTCNFREWLHVIALRSSSNKRAHPQIRQIIDMARDILAKKCPIIFNELE